MKKNKLEILKLSLKGIKNDETFKEMKKLLLKIRILLILEEEGLNKRKKPRENVIKYFKSLLNKKDGMERGKKLTKLGKIWVKAAIKDMKKREKEISNKKKTKKRKTGEKEELVIVESDINLFYSSGTRSTNDRINKKREKIICDLWNKRISNDWIENNSKWRDLYEEIKEFVNSLVEDYNGCVLKLKGGRGKHHDIEAVFTMKDGEKFTKKIEFKYGASKINDCPQFVSPMKPSQYFNISYEDYFYNEYLPQIAKKYELDIPDKETYLKQIHGNKPTCMRKFLDKYYMGSKGSKSKYTGDTNDIENYNFTKILINDSIENFLKTAIFNTEKMNNYLRYTQKDKIYLLCNNGKFNKQERDENDYQIDKIESKIKNNNCLTGTTKSGYTINLLLRWKNGLAFPAFQIS